MKHSQEIVLALGTVAAITGIYFAATPPFTHIAAAAVLLAMIVGLAQALQAEEEAAFVKQTLSQLARSTPPSAWWKDKVRETVQKICSSRGYSLYRLLHDSSNPQDPDAHSIFLFKSLETHSNQPNGVFVLSPSDYAELSLLAKSQIDSEVRQLVFGTWNTNSAAEVANRICETAEALYRLPRINQGYKIAIQPQSDSEPLVIVLGSLELSFDRETVARLVEQAPIQRDLSIARVMQEKDPELSRYLVVSR